MNNLKYFLDEKAQQYNHPHFIETDPIQIPHLFSKKEDIEISGLLTALIAWGKREMIIRNAREWMRLMDDSPHDFILNHKSEDLKSLREFKHRTFQFVDTVHFLASLQNIYRKYGGLRHLFSITPKESDSQGAIMRFREVFFSIPYEKRTQKHISNPEKGSASKRLNMFLRFGWCEKIATEWIWGFGVIFHLQNFLARSIYIQHELRGNSVCFQGKKTTSKQ